jgi:hypothetical protein
MVDMEAETDGSEGIGQQEIRGFVLWGLIWRLLLRF